MDVVGTFLERDLGVNLMLGDALLELAQNYSIMVDDVGTCANVVFGMYFQLQFQVELGRIQRSTVE
jgi:hypothetical protein